MRNSINAHSGSRGKWSEDLHPKASKAAVNMHRLWESFVEKVIDVRRRVTADGKATAPRESLEFLALIQGWQSEDRRERRERLLQLNGLRAALEHALGESGRSRTKGV